MQIENEALKKAMPIHLKYMHTEREILNKKNTRPEREEQKKKTSHGTPIFKNEQQEDKTALY